ncbi:CGNR zinc finger domain-containing protein [Oceanitalea stevensii]|uniref:ABATE domain-containing protein n=1 Tax=Oceanitalea stevensii TaxID=2763072 RepID=A0ABR8Z311_9MICO|nr:CGNR zinc finger domain-containing protein [Oceanitalea stevensii]MBD8062727.1 ABATE domain-containing protein [Oceanitalea stevensii]
MDDEQDVPAAARLVRDFVNTREPQTDEEQLVTPDSLAAWLNGRGLLPPGAAVTASDLRRAVAVREGLRQVLLEHAGHEVDRGPLDELERELAAVPVRVTLGAGGPRLVAATSEPWHNALAGLLDAVRRSAQDGTWPRLKVCARDTCRWAFYDASRNQARRWCSMAGCGNHVKMKRAYAVRKQRTTGAG